MAHKNMMGSPDLIECHTIHTNARVCTAVIHLVETLQGAPECWDHYQQIGAGFKCLHDYIQ